VNRSPALLLLSLAMVALSVGLSACARTALTPECPVGYIANGDTCECLTDQACPTGMRCEAGVCACRDTA